MGRYYDEQGRPMELMDWARAFEQRDPIARTERDDVCVSTVWLGIDHNFFGQGPPLIFETMIFGGEHDHYQERYTTREQAEEGHQRACVLAFGATSDGKGT